MLTALKIKVSKYTVLVKRTPKLNKHVQTNKVSTLKKKKTRDH